MFTNLLRKDKWTHMWEREMPKNITSDHRKSETKQRIT
jgi:hypothetical protein